MTSVLEQACDRCDEHFQTYVLIQSVTSELTTFQRSLVEKGVEPCKAVFGTFPFFTAFTEFLTAVCVAISLNTPHTGMMVLC